MTNNRFKVVTGFCSLAIAAMLFGCATSPSYMYSPPPVGSTWVTAQQNTGSYGSGKREIPGTRGERMWQGKQYERSRIQSRRSSRIAQAPFTAS
jgi:hypothetical protein